MNKNKKMQVNQLTQYYMNGLFSQVPEKDYVFLYQKYEEIIKEEVEKLKYSYKKGEEEILNLNANEIAKVYMQSECGVQSARIFVNKWAKNYLSIINTINKECRENALCRSVAVLINPDEIIKLYMDKNYLKITPEEYTKKWIKALIEIDYSINYSLLNKKKIR